MVDGLHGSACFNREYPRVRQLLLLETDGHGLAKQCGIITATATGCQGSHRRGTRRRYTVEGTTGCGETIS